MANCISCGRELPAFSFGQSSDVCPECRSKAVEVRTFSTAAPASPSPSSAPSGLAPARKRPPITTVLVGLNLAVFVAMLLSGISVTEPTVAQLRQWGANWGPLSLGSQPWRMFSSNYLHIGIVHILFNMWCLWDLGSLAERIFEPWTYVLTYTACGIAGSLASLWWHPLVVGAGASGAIFGLAGALIAALYLGKLPIPKKAMQQTLRSLLIFAVYNLGFGAVGGGIDNSAHIGGLLCGLILGAVLAKQLLSPAEVRASWRLGVFAVTTIVLIVAFVQVRKVNAYVVPLGMGAEALDKGRIDEGLHLVLDAAAKKPNDPVVLSVLGHAYLLNKDYANAARVLQPAVQMDPQDAGTQYDFGFALFKLGETRQAIAPLEKATQLDPKNAGALWILAQSYAAQNMPQQAQEAFERANQLTKPAK